MANNGHQIAVAARLRPEHAKPFSPLWKVTRFTSPANTSWVDGSELDLMRIARTSLLISRRAVVTSRSLGSCRRSLRGDLLKFIVAAGSLANTTLPLR